MQKKEFYNQRCIITILYSITTLIKIKKSSFIMKKNVQGSVERFISKENSSIFALNYNFICDSSQEIEWKTLINPSLIK